jgi:predicted alpha/beta hydrolase family esterase
VVFANARSLGCPALSIHITVSSIDEFTGSYLIANQIHSRMRKYQEKIAIFEMPKEENTFIKFLS